ncbi:hypothetical protein BC940DRAFT_346598 [Gongronella butleri]|nr:hypothetical protein BC940DRAFT_346598 [Gongronella butleri]
MAVPTERTPLLNQASSHTEDGQEHVVASSRRQLGHMRRSWQSYASVFAAVVVFLLGIYACRSALPRALSDVEAYEANDFAGLHAYNEYLTRFAMPHSGNQVGNAEMYQWIAGHVEDLAAVAHSNKIKADVITSDNTTLVTQSNRFVKGEYWYLESRNVLLRLHGQKGSLDDALLIDAHYDGVSTSHGVTDNGMGVATALELARYFVNHPPDQTIIFFFNNMEEAGLLGAQLFVKHPWFKTVKLFLDLEGTGSGGRALLFRATNYASVQALASSGARYLHATPFGNDMLRSGLIRSDTDFTTYTQHGVPGVDIAFYNPRANYHTKNDDLAHTSPSSLQHMGHMALNWVREVDASESMVRDASNDRFIYFDILGHSMVVYSFTTSKIINITSLVLVPLVWLAWFAWHLRRSENKRAASIRSLTTLGQGILATLLASLFILAVDALVVFALLHLKPFVTYGNIYLVGFCLLLSSVLAVFMSQWVLSRIQSVHEALLDENTSLYGLVVVSWAFVIWAEVLGEQEIALGYIAIYILGSTVLALLASLAYQWYLDDRASAHTIASLPWIKSARAPLVFIIQLALPLVLLADVCFTTMDGLRHVSPDGTPELSVYVAMSVPIAVFSLLLLPWSHLSHDKARPVGALALALLVVFISCLAAPAFNAHGSPNRILFNQFYNVSDGVSTVRLVSGQGLDATLAHYLPAPEASSVQCVPEDDGYQQKCEYTTFAHPWYAQNTDEYSLTVVDVSHNSSLVESGSRQRHWRVSLAVQHSQFCHLGTNAEIQRARFRNSDLTIDQDKQTADAHHLAAYVDVRGEPMVWDLAVNDKISETPYVQATCYYDDWTDGQLPAFTTLRNRLPEAQALTMRGGVGLAMVTFPAVNV